jgi:hypothetical protein
MKRIVWLLQFARWPLRTPEVISKQKEAYFHMRATTGYTAKPVKPGKQKRNAIWMAERMQ